MNTFLLWTLIVLGGAVFAVLGAAGFRLIVPRRRPTGLIALRSAGFVLATVVVGVIIGRLADWDALRRLDESVHESIFLVQNDLMVRAMIAVTGIGSITATGFIAVLLAAGVGYNYRSLRVAIVPLVGYVIALQGQRLVDKLDDRAKPPLELSVGIPGGYPSGGTIRVVLIIGMLMVVFAQIWREDRDIRLLGAAWGVIAWTEIISRAVLGRHWPLDLIGGLVMGLLLLAAMGPLLSLPTSGQDRRVAAAEPPPTA